MAAIFFMFNAIWYDASNYIGRFMVIYPIFVVIFSVDSTSFYGIMQKVVSLMVAIAAVSIFFWFFSSILHFISPSGYIYANWGGGYQRFDSFHRLYFQRQDEVFFGHYFIRNIGCFTEAPMYSFCLTVAILAEVFLYETNRVRILILYVALITTFSTTGIVIGIMALVGKYFMENEIKDRKEILYIVAIGTIIVWLGGYAAYRILMEKIGIRGWAGRLAGLQKGFGLMNSNFMFGAGFSNEETRSKAGSVLISGVGTIMAQGGIILLVMNLIPFVFIWSRKGYKESIKRLSIFAAFIFLELFMSVVQYQPIMLMIQAALLGVGINSSRNYAE
ncbi:MAG: hypothetical protein IJ682_01750 [Lachnospiraceae bacterium]|nr:hypothetical protein [Lachnospiraceae bacterium]